MPWNSYPIQSQTDALKIRMMEELTKALPHLDGLELTKLRKTIEDLDIQVEITAQDEADVERLGVAVVIIPLEPPPERTLMLV